MDLDFGYRIRRVDRWNWALTQTKLATAQSASKYRRKGDQYWREDHVGFFPSLALAFAKYCDLTFLVGEDDADSDEESRTETDDR